MVVDIPKHLSPNGDGSYNIWHIVGIETLPGTVIQIFDRYGKLITILKHTDLVRYVADIIQDGKQCQLKGHFALRR